MVTTALAFRPHTLSRVPTDNGVFSQLHRDWTRLCGLPTTADTLASWVKQQPALDGVDSLPGVLDEIDHSPKARTDQLLLALVCLCQGGDTVAGQTVLQAMLPKLCQVIRRLPRADNGGVTRAVEQSRQWVIAEFWQVLATYPVERRPRSVAGNLALDTLHRVTVGTRRPVAEIPASSLGLRVEGPTPLNGPDRAYAEEGVVHSVRPDTAFVEILASIGAISEESSLCEVLAWATDIDVISADTAALLLEVYAPQPGATGGADAAARRRGLSSACVRKRCSRATGVLAAAVHTYVHDPMALAAPYQLWMPSGMLPA